MSGELMCEEVAGQLRKAIRGEVSVRLIDPELSWSRVYAGNVAFSFGDWRIDVFNDCNDLDYIEFASSPDGRQSDTDDWCKEAEDECGWRNPLDLLDVQEQLDLERILEAAE